MDGVERLDGGPRSAVTVGQAHSLLRELERPAVAGQPAEHAELSTADLREQVPLASTVQARGWKVCRA